MKENKEFETVVSDVDNNGTKTFEVKNEKIYQRKDLIITAIIAFLIGAVLTTGGFTISKALRGRRGEKNFRTNGIQRNINQEDFNNGQSLNENQGKMNRRGNRPSSNEQSIPNTTNDQQNNNQNPPSIPNNEQQPNNSNVTPSVPNNNNQNSTSNKS